MQPRGSDPWGLWGSAGIYGAGRDLWGRQGSMGQCGAHDVGAELDEEDGDAAEGQRDAGGDVDEVRRQFGDVFGQSVRDGLLQVVEDQAAYGGGRTL